MSAGIDFSFGIRCSAVLGFANITHRLNSEAAGKVQACIVILGIIAERLAFHNLWHSKEGLLKTGHIVCTEVLRAEGIKLMTLLLKKNYIIQCSVIYTLRTDTPHR